MWGPQLYYLDPRTLVLSMVTASDSPTQPSWYDLNAYWMTKLKCGQSERGREYNYEYNSFLMSSKASRAKALRKRSVLKKLSSHWLGRSGKKYSRHLNFRRSAFLTPLHWQSVTSVGFLNGFMTDLAKWMAPLSMRSRLVSCSCSRDIPAGTLGQ